MNPRRVFLTGGVAAVAAGASAGAARAPKFSAFDFEPHRIWRAPGGEDIVGIHSLNDRLYVFTKTAVYEFPG